MPPFIEEGIVRHVCTYFDGTWTNEMKLKADASRVAADGFVDPVGLINARDPLYAMLFVDLLVYSEDPFLRGKLKMLYRGREQDPAKILNDDRMRKLWREQLERFAKTRWTIPRVYR